MDPTLIGSIVSSAIAGIGAGLGGYWVYLRQTKERREASTQTGYDNRVADLKEYQEREREAWARERADLQKRLEQATAIAAQNTTSLENANRNSDVMTAQIERLLTILEPERG